MQATVETAVRLAPRFEPGRKLRVAGLRASFSRENLHQISNLWRQVAATGALAGPSRVTWGVVWLGRDGCDYLAGREYQPGEALPKGFVTADIGADQYAAFEHAGDVSSLNNTFGQIQHEWLPSSGYALERSEGMPVCLERYGERFNPATGAGDIEIWAPLQPRVQFESNGRITPFLWFDSNAEEAVEFYRGIFKNSRRLDQLTANEHGHASKGKPLTITFELDGQRFVALNGGPLFRFTEAVSFVVRCDSQAEVDEYWSKLSAGGAESQCGWLKDKFGLSWQIVPARLPELLRKPKAFQAMLGMRKLIIADLEKAAQEN